MHFECRKTPFQRLNVNSQNSKYYNSVRFGRKRMEHFLVPFLDAGKYILKYKFQGEGGVNKTNAISKSYT